MKVKIFTLFIILGLSSCAFQPIHRTKNITYLEADSEQNLPEKQLNVFYQKKGKDLPVMIFIHGGSWNKGRKEIYDFMGSRMARRDVITVIIDYPLAPAYQLPPMELASVRAVKWVYENIENYGGDKDKIFISGHSAGGHLAALAAIKKEPYEKLGFANPLKGAILNDPAGLDWYWFLNERKGEPDGKDNYDAFTDDPAVWKEYSPIYFIDGKEIPILIMEGEETYPGIRLTIDRFRKRAEETQTELDYSLYKKTKHIPMVTQFFWTWSKGYDDVLNFIEAEK
ncbi:MAG: alpha/beta hydrolase [Algoriphagus sp.]|uniref:alpha/beta hydrolase n=1 Tax=Algoriphagus sp. TaxID=1872435 RepID=UPI00260B0F3D|nr:alpha/beta hydrolase [Algoriphagus sp.]MDG1277349.1 alpha/beta hydrolase [Algoriphagus sp.]